MILPAKVIEATGPWRWQPNIGVKAFLSSKPKVVPAVSNKALAWNNVLELLIFHKVTKEHLARCILAVDSCERDISDFNLLSADKADLIIFTLTYVE